MKYQLEAQTDPGRRLVELAEMHAEAFAAGVAEHDREGRFGAEHIEELRRSGYLAAPVPEELGGMGVDRVYDVLVAATRLARADASATIASNMHFGAVIRQVRARQRALAEGDCERAASISAGLQRVAMGEMINAALITEAGRELVEPATTARREGDEWVIDGRKIFATMSPAATHLNVSATLVDDGVEGQYGMFFVPAGTPSVCINDDWDALGMRSSGSGSVTLSGVRVPAGALREALPVGEWDGRALERFLFSGLMHASASFGIAEAAHELGVNTVAGGRKGRHGRPLAERATLQLLAAESTIDLAAMRATFGRAAELVDEHRARYAARVPPVEASRSVFAETQAAKTFVHQAAIRIVDRALTLSGGATPRTVLRRAD